MKSLKVISITVLQMGWICSYAARSVAGRCKCRNRKPVFKQPSEYPTAPVIEGHALLQGTTKIIRWNWLVFIICNELKSYLINLLSINLLLLIFYWKYLNLFEIGSVLSCMVLIVPCNKILPSNGHICVYVMLSTAGMGGFTAVMQLF